MTDSAANEVKAFSLLEWPRLPRFGHNLNLAVKAGTAIAEVNKIVAKSRNLVSFFHRSPQATTLLKEKQVTMFPHDKTKHNLNLLQDTPTRWNSTMAVGEANITDACHPLPGRQPNCQRRNQGLAIHFSGFQ